MRAKRFSIVLVSSWAAQTVGYNAWAQTATTTAAKGAVKSTSEGGPVPPPIGLWGQHGLHRTYSSDLKGHAMTVSLAGTFELSYVKDALVGGDTNSRFGGHLSVLFIPLEFLEVSATYHMLLNSNDRPAPGSQETLQLLGDVNLDVRGAVSFPLARGRLGLSLGPHIRFLSGSKSLFAPEAFSVGVMFGATYVFPNERPLKLHFNFGIFNDRTRFLLEGFRTSGDAASSLGELYGRVDGAAISAYGISAYSPTFLFRVGVEVPFKHVTPWAEYSLDLQSASAMAPYLSSNLNAGDHPQHLIVGARAFVSRDRALTLGGALDFGFDGGRRANTVGVPGQLPWSLIVNLAYTFGRSPEQKVITIKETVIEKVEVKTTGGLMVTVVDEATKAPLRDVEVHIGKKRALTDKGGKVSEELPQGTVIVRAERFSHLPSEKRAVEIKAGLSTEIEIVLSRKVNQLGLLVGQVADVSGKPLKATVTLDNGKIRAVCADDGKFSVALPPGKYQIEISHPGYIRFNGVVDIQADTQVIQDSTLHKDI